VGCVVLNALVPRLRDGFAARDSRRRRFIWHRPSYFVLVFLRLRQREGRFEVAGPIHLGQVERIAEKQSRLSSHAAARQVDNQNGTVTGAMCRRSR
jgi:hypothetical protein